MTDDRERIAAEHIARCLAGEPEAFAALIAPYRDSLFTYLLRMTADRGQAEDLLQETLVRAWQGLPGYRHRGRFGAWLFRIAYTTALNALRHARVREAVGFVGDLPEYSGAEAADAPLLAGEVEEILRRAVLALPEKQRQVFLLRRHGNLPFKEIAGLMQAPLSTVLSHMQYAVGKLKKAVEAYHAR